jgi:hypothetical protein
MPCATYDGRIWWRRKHYRGRQEKLCAIAIHSCLSDGMHVSCEARSSYRSQVGLVGGAIEFNHLLVDGLLLSHIHTLQGRSNEGLHILDGLEHALAQVTTLVLIAKLAGLVDASGCTWVKIRISDSDGALDQLVITHPDEGR